VLNEELKFNGKEILLEGKIYLSLKSAAAISGYHSDYLGRLARRKKIRSKRVGKQWFIEKDSVLALPRVNGSRALLNISHEPLILESTADYLKTADLGLDAEGAMQPEIVEASFPANIVPAAVEPFIRDFDTHELRSSKVERTTPYNREQFLWRKWIPVVVLTTLILLLTWNYDYLLGAAITFHNTFRAEKKVAVTPPPPPPEVPTPQPPAIPESLLAEYGTLADELAQLKTEVESLRNSRSIVRIEGEHTIERRIEKIVSGISEADVNKKIFDLEQALQTKINGLDRSVSIVQRIDNLGNVTLGSITSSNSIDTDDLTVGNLTITGTCTGCPSGGGGSGTVNSGIAGALAFYPATGTTLDDASTLLWDDTNQFLGIGTTSPAFKLSVVGEGIITGNLSVGTLVATGTTRFNGVTYTWPGAITAGNFLQVDSSGNLTWSAAGSGGGSDSSFIFASTDGGYLRMATTTNRLGIGTTTPYAKLSVNSGSIATTTLALVPVSGQTANIIDIYNTSGALTSVLTSSNFLGIGTSSPAYNLSVAGHVLFGGNATATGLIYSQGSGTSTFNGGISANSFASSNGLTITGGNILLTSGATSTFNNGLKLTAGCFEMPSGTCLTNSGGDATTLDGIDSLSFLRSDTNDFFTSGTLTFNGGTNLNLTNVGNNIVLSTDSSGNVVGTTTPSFASINATSTAATSTFAGGLQAGGSTGIYVLQNGNVGIGTAAPTELLQLNGGNLFRSRTADVTHGIKFGDQITPGASDKWSSVTTRGGVSQHLYLNAGRDDALVAGNIIFATDIAGLVGIGTTTPGSILSVQGVGNFQAGTSTIYTGVNAPGFLATSSGLTISGGSILQTNNATNTLAGGVRITGGNLQVSTLTGCNGASVLETDTNGNLQCGSDAGASGVVTSVSNSDSTLTISPTAGDVVASLNLTNPNTWTGLQQFSQASATQLTIGFVNATSSATSTFVGGISAGGLSSSNGLTITGGSILNSSSATSTFSGNGINVTAGCLAQSGACLTNLGQTISNTELENSSITVNSTNSTLSLSGSPVSLGGTLTADLNLSNANNWTGLQRFVNASSTALSSITTITIGGTATTTIQGNNATSTFAGGISTAGFTSSNGLVITGGSLLNTSTATSSFSNGIKLTAGCFEDSTGNCVGKDSSTLGGFTSSQFLRSDTSDNYTSGTLTFNAGTNLQLSNVNAHMLLSTDSSGNVVATSTPQVASINATSTTATSTFAGGLSVSALNVGTTTATSTFASGINVNGLTFTNLGASGCSGLGNDGKLTTDTNGGVICAADAGSSFLYPFTPQTIGGTIHQATSSPMYFSQGLLAASSTLGYLNVGYINATSTTATSTIAGGLTVDGNTFVVDYFNNRVGIGTTSPSYTFSVSGNTLLGGSATATGLIYSMGAGTSTFAGGIQTAGLSSSNGLTITGGNIFATNIPTFLGTSTINNLAVTNS